MADPTLIVTGSSGLIGSTLVDHLAPGYRIIALDKVEPRRVLPENARFFQIDLTSESDVNKVIANAAGEGDAPIASVIHLAAYYDFSGEPSDLYEQVTVQGTRRLLDALQPYPVEQFIFSSTMLVHQPAKPGHPITEQAPLEAKWDYPQSKIDTERLIHERRGDILAVHLRVAGVYTDMCDSIPIAHQIQRINENRLTSHVYPGDTSRGQAFVHLDDLVAAIRATVEQRTSLPDEIPILIGEPDTYSYDTLQRTLGRLIHDHEEWVTQQIPKTVAKTGAWVQNQIPGVEEPFIKPWMIDMADDHYELDITRARDLLDWSPRHRLIDTLPKMVAALKADPKGWYAHHHLEPPEDLS